MTRLSGMCQYSCIRETIRDTYEIEAIPMIYEEYEDVGTSNVICINTYTPNTY